MAFPWSDHFLRSRSILLLLVLSCSGCEVSEEPSQPGHEDPLEIWQQHETAIQRAVDGYIIDDEFRDACEFFLELTGIDVRGDGSYIGWLPTEETKEDLVSLQLWLDENRQRLDWDRDQREVTLLSEQAP